MSQGRRLLGIAYVSLAASKDLGPNLIVTLVDQQVDVELGVGLSVSILHVNKAHPHKEIIIGHQVLLAKHVEVDGLLFAKVDNCSI